MRAVITGEQLAERGLAWMPTLSPRRAGGARHRRGALPGAGGGVRRRGDPLRRPRRARADRRRVRAAARRGRRPPRAGRRRAARARQARQPRLRLGGGRRRGHRRRVRGRRARERLRPGLPAGAPGAAGDLRHRGRPRPDHREAHRVGDGPGPARAPGAALAGDGYPGAPDPHRGARHRRRVRQQGRASTRRTCARWWRRSWWAPRSSGWRTARRTSWPRRSPATTTCAARSRRPATGGSPRCACGCSPTTARSTPPRSPRASPRGSSTPSPAPTTCPPRTAGSPACTRTRRPAASPTRARSG